ncbi:MAG TPA: hypothetical protein PKA64_15810 [Myxococcota bacterium]|nr:hypothetical protein [Myxococcota bacterium]
MTLRKLVLALSLFPTIASAADLHTCDIALLSRLWSKNDVVTEAEASHMAQSDPARYAAELQRAREAVTPTGWAVCAYYEYGFDYNDAEALARAWGMSDPSDAKARMEQKIMYHEVDELKAQVRAARAATPTPTPNMSSEYGPYNLCDLDVLAAYWKKDLPEIKTLVRTNVAAGTPQKVEKRLAPARAALAGDTSMCPFWELPYTYDDAEAIASAWGVDVAQVKARIEKKARAGNLSVIDSKLALLGRR